MLAREPGRLRTAVGSSKDRIVEGIVYRHRAGIAWRNLPREHFGPWQTAWKRHRRYMP
ncbi:transposase [Brevibacterium luteolum]|uniref:transposase n=1 Tax=Brevibacterium luteolum TaxID=199591 RepID=UPI0035CD061F